MAKQTLKWGGGLIALYLVVRNWNGATRLISSAGTSTSTVVKTFQGR